MDDMIASMLNALFGFDTTSLDNLTEGLESYNKTAYDFVNNVHTTAVVPISSTVIAIILILELARNATRIEGDQQMGVKIIAGTMFKSALLVIAAQNSMLFLDAINQIATAVASGIKPAAEETDGGMPSAASLPGMPADIADSVSKASNVDKAGMMMLLIIPFLIALAAKIVIQVMVTLRFAELYLLTAFASLPIAFIGHQDTKSMGVGYLQRYASVALHGATLMLVARVYAVLLGGDELPSLGSGQSLSSWIVSNYDRFLLSPVLLMILIMASGRIAKAVVGQ